jgi:hypothetical protein
MDRIVLQLDGQDYDPAEIDEALRVLSQELSTAPDLDVRHQTEAPPPNTKSAVGALAALGISLLGTRGASSAINVLGDFLSRYKNLKIKVKRGETVYEISGANPRELAALLPLLGDLGAG